MYKGYNAYKKITGTFGVHFTFPCYCFITVMTTGKMILFTGAGYEFRAI